MKAAEAGYLSDITNAETLEELWDRHIKVMADYGFPRLLYGYTNFRVDYNLGDPEDFVILTNLHRDFMDPLFNDRKFLHGPMVKWALNNVGFSSWRLISDQAQAGLLTKDELETIQFNVMHGLTAGYTVSFKTVSQRSKGAISLIGGVGVSQDELDEIWARHSDILVLMNNVLHLKILNLPYQNPKRALTKRQREVLEWVADGKTIQDIATLLGRTTATVEKHLRLARESLSVETTPQAVVKATFLNQMFKIEG